MLRFTDESYSERIVFGDWRSYLQGYSGAFLTHRGHLCVFCAILYTVSNTFGDSLVHLFCFVLQEIHQLVPYTQCDQYEVSASPEPPLLQWLLAGCCGYCQSVDRLEGHSASTNNIYHGTCHQCVGDIGWVMGETFCLYRFQRFTFTLTQINLRKQTSQAKTESNGGSSSSSSSRRSRSRSRSRRRYRHRRMADCTVST